VLGWLRPSHFFGGRLDLDLAAARTAVRDHVAEPLGLGLEEAALGIHTVVTHNMAATITQLSVRRGLDPREFHIVAQGGAGPLFACAVSAQVGARSVVVPPLPGLASAFGLLETDLRYEGASTVWQTSEAPDWGALRETVERLTAEARTLLDADGVPPELQSFIRYVDCRYPSQGYELRVAAGDGTVDAAWVAGVANSFHELHHSTYRSRFDDRPVHLVNVRVVGVGAVAAPVAFPQTTAVQHEPEPVDAISSWFRVGGNPRPFDTPVYERAMLRPGAVVAGPGVIEQPDSTTVVEPGFVARVDAHQNLIIVKQRGGQ
jgi:N-methylhydantoinase A/oxoprolinase/acetone carboxylase beta subunit